MFAQTDSDIENEALIVDKEDIEPEDVLETQINEDLDDGVTFVQ